MENTLLQELVAKRDSALRLMNDFEIDARKEFELGHELQEQACNRLAREFGGMAKAYTTSIELIKEYIGISE